MKKAELDFLNDKFINASPEDVLIWASSQFAKDRLTFASSLGAEDQVLTHIIHINRLDIPIFTIDTGFLYPESYQLIEQTQKAYVFKYDILKPDNQAVQKMVGTYGERLFYESLDLRKHCCQVRKIEPLKKKLGNFDAWICGLRREQSITRANIKKFEWDESFNIVKINPMVDWSNKQVWDYIKQHDVPYHILHDRGYPSIGCAPCTRAIKPGADIRAGRWWWESSENKECGLHVGRKDKNKE